MFGAAAAATLAAFAEIPVSVTKGEDCEVPSFKGLPFVQEGEAAAIKVPNEGWTIDWQRECPKGSNDVTGLKVEATKVELRGKEVPAIRITCTPGKFRNWPLVALPFEVDFSKWNVFSFSAKVEYPEGVKPLMLDSTPMIGWYSASFFERWDDFGIAADDATTLPWAGNGVHTTDFKNHDYPATRTTDGFTDFRWDVPHEERTGYKGFVENRVRSLYFMYDTRKIKEGQKVVITIADMKVVKGWHKKFSEPERYAAWLKRVAEYEPDCSDSSDYLEPPETGRLGFFSRVRLAQGGVAQAEIVADVSDDVLLDKWFKKPVTDLLVIKQSRGKERQQTRAAAYELQKWLKELTGGAEFPVVERPTDPDKAKIFLGAGFAKDLFADDLKALADGKGGVDGFAVRVRDGNVYIFGAHSMGTSNGVFAFLENNTDVIWAMANDPDGTVFTPDPDLTVVWGDALEKPAFRIRGWQGGDAEWKRQNRSNFWLSGADYGFSVSGGHYLSPQYYQFCEGIQDFNAEIKGKRTKPWTEYRQLCCLADPEFPKHAWESVPCLKNIGYGGTFNCVFGTDDNCGVCECAKCTAPIKTIDGRMLTPDVDYQGYYGAWFYTYLNKLDNEIQKICPGFMTSTFAYFFACSYPPIKVNKTIVPWLCTYYRKAYNQPIYAPANQDWWKIYNDWAKHSNQIYLYDYYGLGMREAPLAEVYQEDLKAQRDIGFLATSTEGFGGNQYCGCGDERWVMARLAWNPDADVEQLHRYFNRRPYREAAPWMDRFFGTIRKSVLQQGHFHMDFEDGEENSLVGDLIRGLGIEDELRGYLNKALAEVKHPTARVNIERTLADFNFYMQTGKANSWSFPGDDGNWFRAHPRKEAAAWTKIRSAGKPLAEAEWVAKEQALNAAADSGKEDATYKQMAIVARDGRLGQEKVVGALRGALIRLVRAKKGAMDVEKVCELVRKHDGDIRGKALGYSLAAAQPWGKSAWGWFIDELAKAYSDFGCWTEVSRLYDYWAHCDGEKTPEEYVSERYGRGLSMLRSRKDQTERAAKQTADRAKAEPASTPAQEAAATAAARLQRLNAQIARDRDRFMKAAAVTVKAGSDHRVRYRAERSLFDENYDRMSSDARKAQIEAWVKNDMLFDDDRKAAASLIIAEYINNQSTNCTALAEHAHKLLAIGDWRNNFYINHRNWRNDYKRDFMIGVSDAIVKAGAKDVAKAFIERAAKDLGYTAAYDKPDANGKEAPGWKKEVAKWVDDAMKRCGAVRQ